MTKIVKLTESDLTNIIKRVISEQDEYYNPDRMYRRESMVARIKRGPKFIHKYIKNFEDAQDEYLKQDFLPGEEELFKPLLKEWEDFKLLGGNILKYNSSSNLADKEKMITIFKVDCPEAASKVDNYLTKLNSFHRDIVEGFIKDAEFQTKQSSFLSILIGSIGILLGLLVGVLISNKTSLNIQSG